MRLRSAIALDEFEEDRVSGFGAREDRRARREARREQRQQRREDRRERRSERRTTRKGERGERRLARVQRKKTQAYDKLTQVPGSPLAPVYPSALPPAPEPTLQPAPLTWPPPVQAPTPAPQDDGWLEDGAEQVEEPLEPDAAESTEGMGAWPPLVRPVAAPQGEGAWGPAVRMGRSLRIQAAVGYRAAVIDLKPGLYLVAELPEAVTRTEFGVAPLLAPLILTAARRAIDAPPREPRGPLAALFRRRRAEPVRYVQVQPPTPTAPAPALPGPVAEPPAVVAAPNVGWADDATVAAAYGCDTCGRNRR